MPSQRLSAYRLINMPAAAGFDAAIKADVLDDLAQFEIQRPDFAAKLFVQSSEPSFRRTRTRDHDEAVKWRLVGRDLQ